MNFRTVWGLGAIIVFFGFLAVADCTAAQRRPVWERIDQFIAVEKQDAAAPPNDHPAQVRQDRLRATLGSLQVVMEKGDAPVPLFTAGELDILAEGAAKALAAAGPTDDVTFAVIGLHGALLGLFKQPMVTTGRLFYREGQINLILGQVHEPVNDRDDRRLKPFIPGSRTPQPTQMWRLTTTSGVQPVFAEGRADWVVLKPVDPVAEAPASLPSKAAAEDSVKPQPSAPPQRPADATAKTIEERLRLLKDLREKNLITEEEYQAKRKEILSLL